MNRDGLPASLRAAADRKAQRYQELKKLEKTGLLKPPAKALPPAEQAPARSPQSSSSSSRPLESDEDEDEDEDDSSVAESQEIELDPADLADSDDGALVDSEAETPPSVDDLPLDELEDSDLLEEVGDDDDAEDDDDMSEDGPVPEAADVQEEEQPFNPAAEAAAVRARLLSPAHAHVVYSLLADPTAQDTIRTVLMRHGHPQEVIDKISREVESDLLFALRTLEEHIMAILVSPPAVTEPGIAAALRTRAKNSRDLRHAMNYLDAFRKPVLDRSLAVAAYRGPARSAATPNALKRKLASIL
jgi:hypothetical protein